MAIPSKPLTIGGMILGGGAAATGGTYALTKESIKNKVENNVLPKDGVNEEWKIKVAKAKKDENLKSQIFKSTVTGDEAERKALFDWCQEKLGESYGSAFSSKDDNLLNKVKDLCIYSIKEKLNETSRLLTTDDNFKELIKKLKANKEDTTLSQEFKEVAKKGVVTDDEGWQEFKKLCESIYEKGYQGIKDSNLTFASKYCAKATIQEKLNGTELPKTGTTFDTDWTTKVNNAKAASNTTAKDTKLKAKLDATGSTKKDLQDWCDAQYVKAHDLETPNDTSKTKLLEEVKKLCALTIKEKLGTNARAANDASKDSEWQTKMTNLKSYPPTGSSNKPQLAFGLEKLKEKYKTPVDNKGWEELKNWCKETYEKGYKADELWKLADEFCKNP